MTGPVRLDGRVAVVTGAGRGLGRAYALDLARRGAAVVVNDLGGPVDGTGDADRRPADEVVAEIEAAGGRAVASHETVATPDGASAIVATALDAFGAVDAVVANAGILRGRSFRNATADDLDAHLDVHVKGSFLVAHAAWPAMREQGYGRLVFVSSMAGIFGLFGSAAYATAKAALVGLTNVLAIEGAPRGIKANAIAPVASSTRMAGNAEGREVPPAMSAEAVAPMVTYLASEACAPTGSVFSVGGGRFARVAPASAPGWRAPESPTTAEEVAAHLDEICDLSAPLWFETGDEEMRVVTGER